MTTIITNMKRNNQAYREWLAADARFRIEQARAEAAARSGERGEVIKFLATGEHGGSVNLEAFRQLSEAERIAKFRTMSAADKRGLAIQAAAAKGRHDEAIEVYLEALEEKFGGRAA